MSHHKTPPSAKSYNPMHSSYVFGTHMVASQVKQDDQHTKLSSFYTKATSQVGENDNQQYHNLMENYENRIKNMQQGFERSKSQFENSIKNMYKEKIILLNIIAHNQTLIDEFRNKLKLNSNSSFKEIETKYNIISSGLFHSQLCPDCIQNISMADWQFKSPERERESVRNPQLTVLKGKLKKLSVVQQYQWMYVPQEENQAVIKLKIENYKLKIALEQLNQESVWRINEKAKEIQLLKAQLIKALNVPPQVIVKVQVPNEGETEKIASRYKEKVKLLEEKVQKAKLQREKYESIIRELNDKVMACEIEKLSLKYRGKFF